MNNKNYAKLDILLEDSILSYYWMGFLIADGHFSKINRLKLVLAIKDKSHLQSFADFIGYQKEIRTNINKINNKQHLNCEIQVMDTKIVQKIKDKFDLHHNKTQNPPNLEFYGSLSDELFLALVVGFIDGDGCVTKRATTPFLRLKNYKTWLPFLQFMCFKLQKLIQYNFPPPYINNQGYAAWDSSNTKLLYFLKDFILQKGIPVLKRKWDFDIRPIRSEIAHEKREKISHLVENGIFSPSEIGKKLNLHKGSVYQALYLSANPIITKINDDQL